MEQRLLGRAATSSGSDGRTQRWQQHKQARRDELIDGTAAAVRVLGPDPGMDEIATHIGVSKTVLYRYFGDKNELATAVSEQFLQKSVLPGLTETLTEDLDDYQLVQAVIDVYVRAIADDPQLYRFIMRVEQSSGPSIVAARQLMAETLEFTLRSRLADRGCEPDGARTWALAMVGAAEGAVNGWIAAPWSTVDQLIGELTMMVWGGVAGIVLSGGSPETFAASPPRIPPLVPGDPDSVDDPPRPPA
ncbi:MAG: TetR/AcrR family transcriptional regulator [Gordonia sp. (in: high G+C Gram-positive bacteria)]